MSVSKLHAEHTIFMDNQAGSLGGAIDGHIVMEFKDCQFIRNNRAGNGGALSSRATDLKIENSKFMLNFSTYGGQFSILTRMLRLSIVCFLTI